MGVTNFDILDVSGGVRVNGTEVITSAGAVTADIQASAGSIGTTELADDAVTNTKLANIARGSIKVGGVADVPTDLDASTSGQILVGSGTDLVSVAVSGDATLAANGALTIANNAVSNTKLAAMVAGTIKVGSAAGAASDLAAGAANNLLLAHGGGAEPSWEAMSGDATINSTGVVTIGANRVTPTKMSLAVSAHLGSPVTADDDRIVTVVNLANGAQAIAAYPDCPRNVTVTIVDTTPSITAGTVTIDGIGADGTIISESIDCSAGAGVYTGTKIFANITGVTTSAFDVLGGGGDETIKVGVGNRIGLPSNIQANSAIKVVYLGGTIPGAATYYNGTNTSAVDVSGSTYDGVKHLVVNYNVGQ